MNTKQFLFNQFRQINYGHLLTFRTLEVLDYTLKRSQSSLIFGFSDAFECVCVWGGGGGGGIVYLGVCTEMRVAHILIHSIMCKTILHAF